MRAPPLARYESSTVVIMAGYQAQMHDMLRRNPGLKSRFQEYVHFGDWDSGKCVRLVERLMAEQLPRPFQWEQQQAHEGDDGNEGGAEGAAAETARSELQRAFAELSRRVGHDARERDHKHNHDDHLYDDGHFDDGKNDDDGAEAGVGVLLERPGWANARDAQSMFSLVCKHRDLRLSAQPDDADADSVGAGGGSGGGGGGGGGGRGGGRRDHGAPLEIAVQDVRAAVAEFLAARPKRPQQLQRLWPHLPGPVVAGTHRGGGGGGSGGGGGGDGAASLPTQTAESFLPGVVHSHSHKHQQRTALRAGIPAKEAEDDSGGGDGGDEGGGGDESSAEPAPARRRQQQQQQQRVLASTLLQAEVHAMRELLRSNAALTYEAEQQQQQQQALHRAALQREMEARQRQLEELQRREAEEALARERLQALERALAEAKRKADEEEARRVAAELAEARRRAEELARELRRQREVAERAARIRAALAATGRCCAGYAWCREGGGFRCAGGSHTASFAEIARASGLSVEEVSGH